MTELPPLPKPDIEDHDYEVWGQNVRADFVTVEKMRKYGEACAAAERERAASVAGCYDLGTPDGQAIASAIRGD